MTRKEKSNVLYLPVLLSRVWHGLCDNYCFDMAAELAFYFLYSIFPFIIFLVAMASYFPMVANSERILSLIKEFLPDYLFAMAGPTILNLLFEPHGLLAVGTLVLALWSASSAVSSLMSALNRIHGVQELRSYWHTKAISLLLTAALVGVIRTAFLLLALDPIIRTWLLAEVGFPLALKMVFGALRWAIWMAVMFLVLALVYSYGPDIKRPFKFFSHGALVTLIGQFVFSEFFRIYIQSVGSDNLFYGAVGGIIGLMTWLYVMELLMLAGAQVNHELGEPAAEV